MNVRWTEVWELITGKTTRRFLEATDKIKRSTNGSNGKTPRGKVTIAKHLN